MMPFLLVKLKIVLSTRRNDHRTSNNPDNLPLPVAVHLKSHLFPFNSCWNICVLHNLGLILITSPTAILNSPINSFCPLDTVPVLTSAFNFPSLSSSTLLPVPTPGGSCSKLSRDAIFTVFTYIYSHLIDKDLYESRNLSIKFRVLLCLFMFFFRRPF